MFLNMIYFLKTSSFVIEGGTYCYELSHLIFRHIKTG